MLKVFEVFLLFYFYIDAWHYLSIWYIFIVSQFPCFCLEIYALIYTFIFKHSKYNIIRQKEAEMMRKLSLKKQEENRKGARNNPQSPKPPSKDQLIINNVK